MAEQETDWENEGGALVPTDDQEVSPVETEDKEAEDENTITAEQVLQTLKDKYLGTHTRVAVQLEQDVINPIELARVLDIRPQQVYQAIRHGALKAVKQNNTQKLYIEIDEAARWTALYLNRKLQRAAKAAS